MRDIINRVHYPFIWVYYLYERLVGIITERHVIDTYVKYEQILEENHMENGRVTSSMEFVNDKYKKLMSVGFDHDKLEE